MRRALQRVCRFLPRAQVVEYRLQIRAAAATRTPSGGRRSGCVNTSRAACRNGRSRRCTRGRPGHVPVDAAVGRIADDRDGRSRSGARGSGACGRCAIATLISDTPRRFSAHVTRVTALRARRARVDIFCRSPGSRPIGASMRLPACTRPHTSAMYSFSTSRSWNCRASSWCAVSFLAATITPDVPRSSRCTMPGRSSPPTPLRSSTWWSSALTSGAAGVAGAGMHDHSRPACRYDEVAVLVQDRQRQVLGARGGGRRLRQRRS